MQGKWRQSWGTSPGSITRVAGTGSARGQHRNAHGQRFEVHQPEGFEVRRHEEDVSDRVVGPHIGLRPDEPATLLYAQGFRGVSKLRQLLVLAHDEQGEIQSAPRRSRERFDDSLVAHSATHEQEHGLSVQPHLAAQSLALAATKLVIETRQVDAVVDHVHALRRQGEMPQHVLLDRL